MRHKIRVGLDFDGVVAYNPARIIRAPIKWFKREVLGIKRLKFFVPKNGWERWWWIVVHESSIWPANGTELLKSLVRENKIEAHLVTARFSFLRNNLNSWLATRGMEWVFTTISVNERDQQPHIFKEEVIRRMKFDYFVEDNLDIVEYLHPRVETKILWIFNLIDRNRDYEHKFPYLKRALEAIGNEGSF